MSNQVLLKKSSVVAKVPTSGDLSYGEVALNYADGKLYFKNSSNTVQPLGIAYTKIIANTTAKINQGYICNTGAGSFTLTLPASPETGHYVIISDDNAFGTNPLYVARNGNPIAGIAENLTIDITGVSVTLLWDGGSWNVYSQVGATGGSGSGGTSYNFSSFPQGLIPDYDNTYTLGNSTYKWNYVNSYGYRFGDNTTQTTAAVADGSSITNSGGTITANAGALAGSTLASGVTASSLTSVGTIATGVWNGTVVTGQYGGTGVANTGKTITLGGSLTTSGAYTTTLTATANTSVTLPTTGTLATLAGSETLTNKTINLSSNTLTATSAQIAAAVTDETGSGVLVFGTSPAITTSLTTPSTTFALVNTTATTVNFAGAATTLSVGASTGTTTVNNDLTVTGNLTVNGTTNTINSTTVTVDDKNIELGSVASPTNLTADGGGITLKGATDKTFNWVNATSSWTSSEHLDLASTKAYYIAGTSVLNATTLGSGVTGSSLTSVGTIGTGTWQGTLVAGQYGGTGVNNSGKTITLGGNLTTSGAFATTFTTTSTTSVTLPTSGTLATLAGTETFTNKTLTSPVISTIVNTGTLTLPTSTDTLVGRATTDTLTNKTLTSPTMTTPTLGVASATSINKVTITAPATGSTLTIAEGKTLTASNTLTFTGTDASSVAFGAGGTVLYSGGALGTPSSGTLTNCTFPTLNQNTTGSAATLTTPRAINGVNFDGSAAITVTAAAGTLSGSTLASGVTASSLTSVGTIATGVWNGTAITGQYGGTGVNNSGKTITLGGNLTTSGAFTTTLTATANTNVTLPTSGTLAINGPAFSAYANNTLQTITSGSQQKVLFQVEEFDTNSNYASSTFTPTVAGYYQLNAEVRLDGTSGTGEMMIVLYKNGAEYKRGINQQGTQIAANFWAMQVSSLAYANGSTDYFEIYVQQGSGADRTVTAVNSQAITWFNGCMVRGA